MVGAWADRDSGMATSSTTEKRQMNRVERLIEKATQNNRRTFVEELISALVLVLLESFIAILRRSRSSDGSLLARNTKIPAIKVLFRREKTPFVQEKLPHQCFYSQL